VEPVAGYEAEEGCDDGGKVKEAYVRLSLEHANNMDKEQSGGNVTDLLQSEVVKRGKEDGKRSVDSHNPCECKAVVSTAQQHSRLRDHLPRSHERFPEGAPLLPAFPLLDTDDSSPVRLRDGLLRGGNVSVVEGFFAEEGYEEEANRCHYREEPEAPFPFCDIEDKGCKEGAEVRGEDYESSPDVDFAPAACFKEVWTAKIEETYGCSWKKKISLMNISPP
jgi:hypothetical protein